MISLKIFYDGKHFTSKQTEHKFFDLHVRMAVILRDEDMFLLGIVFNLNGQL
jgi:hypothetical protein